MDVLSLYDGMSCGKIAMQNAGVKLDRYVAYEIDKYAVQTSKHNFPDIEHMGDVFTGDFTKYWHFDFLIGGSPCFTAGHMVLTNKGYKDITKIKIGDMVLTHKNRFMPVTRLYEKKASTVSLKIQGYKPFTTTNNHPFYAIHRSKTEKKFSAYPDWVKVSDMTPDTFCGQHIHTTASVNEYHLTEEECYILGQYAADDHSVHEYAFSSERLVKIAIKFGKSPENKKIPEFIFDLPDNLIDQFIDGYMTGNKSYVHQLDEHIASTMNYELALGFQRLISSYYHTNVEISCAENNKVNNQLYTICFKKELKNQSAAHIQNGIIWTNIESIEETGNVETVYNIEVAEDHSYTVNNCIVHNCTYWSIAHSIDRETEARGIGWELFQQYVRALNEAQPKYFIYENNKSMSTEIRNSIRNTFGFEEICINSSLLSAQKRLRYYWVGKRNNDNTYRRIDIQQPDDLKILLKDILDSQVGITKPVPGRDYNAEPIRVGSYPSPDGTIKNSQGMRIYSVNGKAVNLTAQGGGIGAKTGLYAIPCHMMYPGANKLITKFHGLGELPLNIAGTIHIVHNVINGQIKIKNRTYPTKLSDGLYIIRRLTVPEAKRLQTVPEWYQFPVSDAQAYKMLGNGWTCNVITYLIQCALMSDRIIC